MIGGRAYKRKTQGHIHTLIKIKRFDRDQGLIVVHADGHVIGCARACMKHRIGGQGAAQVKPLGAQILQNGRDDAGFLISHAPFFAGVWVQARNRDTRGVNFKLVAQCGMCNANGLFQKRWCQRSWNAL